MTSEYRSQKIGRRPRMLISSPNIGGRLLEQHLGIQVPVFPEKVDLENTWNRVISFMHPVIRSKLDLTLAQTLRREPPTAVGTYVVRCNTLWMYWGFNPDDVLMTEAHETMHAYIRQTAGIYLRSPLLNAGIAYIVNEGLATWAGIDVLLEGHKSARFADRLKMQKDSYKRGDFNFYDRGQESAYLIIFRKMEEYAKEEMLALQAVNKVLEMLD